MKIFDLSEKYKQPASKIIWGEMRSLPEKKIEDIDMLALQIILFAIEEGGMQRDSGIHIPDTRRVL